MAQMRATGGVAEMSDAPRKEREGGGDGREYVFERIEDLLKVPQDRLPDCLEELAEHLDLVREAVEVARAFGKACGGDGSVTLGPFVWVDDGRRHRTVTIRVREEQVNGGAGGGRQGNDFGRHGAGRERKDANDNRIH